MTVLAEIAQRSRKAADGADADTLVAAGRHALDTTACALSGATHPLAARWIPLLQRRGLEAAVEIEATLAHVDEFDPLHGPAALAPGAVVIPAALLVGTSIGASGREVARAIVAGYEAAIEVSSRFGGAALYAAGWWPTALFGAIGSAAATAVLLRLDPTATTTALAVAAAPLGGLLSTDHLGDAHYLLCGRAAAHGVFAARAAQAGMTASPTLLDGPAATALGRAAGPESAAREPHILRTALKTWPCARPLHTALAALDELAAVGVRPTPGDTVDIALPSAALRFVDTDPRPTSPADAAASAVVAIAGAVAGRARDPRWYREAPAAPRFGIDVRLRGDVDLDAVFPDRWGAEVTVHSVRRRVLIVPGDPDRPVGNEELLAKAMRLAGRPASTLERLLHLADEPDLGILNRWSTRWAGELGRDDMLVDHAASEIESERPHRDTG